MICRGTQNALFSLLVALTSPGEVVLTEVLTYPGMKVPARYAGVRLVGVSIDENGVVPDALEAASRRHAPKAVYLIWTIHNPMTATMPLSRRQEVAEILRRNDVLLLEDDAFRAPDPHAVPLASLIPEQTYFTARLSKCIAPGLRVSFLMTTDHASTELLAAAVVALVTR